MILAAALMLLVTATTAVLAQNEGPLDVPDSPALKDDSGVGTVIPYDLKGDVLGMTLELFKEKHARVSTDRRIIPVCIEAGENDTLQCSLWSQWEEQTNWDSMGDIMLDTIANARAETSYSFFDGQLYAIDSDFSQRDFDEVKQAFLDKFGEPASSEVKEYQSGFGARFTGEVIYWSNSVSFIQLMERNERLDRSVALFIHRTLSDRQTKAGKKNPDL